MTQAVFSPSAALCQLIKMGNIFSSCVREAQLSVQELEYETYASCQTFMGYNLKASQKQNGFKNDWKDSFSLTDGKYRRLGECAFVSVHICI